MLLEEEREMLLEKEREMLLEKEKEDVVVRGEGYVVEGEGRFC
jgi:hypothetical protein